MSTKIDYSKSKPVFPFVLVRRKQNTEETYYSGGLILTPGIKRLDERECLVLSTYGKVSRTLSDGTIVTQECEVKPGDTILVSNYDGENLNDYDDLHIEQVDEANIHAILETVEA